MSLTKHFVEQRIQKNRRAESKNAELRTMLVTHNILAGHGRSESNVEQLRRKRTEAAERRDIFTDYSYVKATQDADRNMHVAQAEERMADELARRKSESERVEQNRRRICQGSEELRVLKERLHAAKVNKERAQQLLEIEMRKERQRRLDHKVAEHMEDQRLESMELDYKIQIDKAKQRENVKRINQKQIETKEGQREEAMQEYVKEKAQVQELVDKITNEDNAEMRAKEQKRKESREMLLRFKVEQAERQEAAEQAEIDENDRIAKFASDKAEREERLARDKEASEKEKERILLSIIAAQEAKNKEAEELEMLRNDLHQEEREHKARRAEQLKQEKRDQDKEDMKSAYVMQMNTNARKRADAIEDEHKIRDALMSKFAEDEKIEQMNDQKRRLRIANHKREAQRLIDMRADQFAAARNAERAEEQRLRDDDADRHIVIEEERRKLLEEHAVPLRDFLPKGTLQHIHDYDMVFPESRLTQYCSKRPGSLTAR